MHIQSLIRKILKYLLTAMLLISLPAIGLSQQIIKGTVKASDNGESLPGVNVIVKGTNHGTVTNFDGFYTLDLKPEEKVLVFSFIGYEDQEIEIGTQTVLNVTLKSKNTAIDELVVIGYGVQKKSDITGATIQLKGTELSKQPVLTATQAMQGKVSGVQIISSGNPGSTPQMRIRGTGTMLGGTHVLYVVDGILTDDITNVNSSDIVDMNILKDASSSAIYGSRGANGVIIITTKKGSSSAGKLNINYNSNIGIRQASNLVKMANAAEYKNYYQAATGIAISGPTANTNWYKTILRNAFEQNQNISISGGSEKATYFFSTSYLNDQGIVLKNNFKRITLRSNIDFNISKYIKTGFQSSYANAINENGFNNLDINENGNIGSAFNDAYRAAPIISPKVGDKYGNVSAFNGQVGNPLLDIENNRVRVAANRIQAAGYLDINPFSFLSYHSSIGTDILFRQARLYDYKFLNDETNFDVAGGNQLNSISYLANKNVQNFKWVWDNYITFSKKFDKHDFKLMVGTTAEKFQETWLSGSRKDVPADSDLWYLYNGLANSSQNDGKGDIWTRNSYMSRLNYSYNDRYMLTATLRRDGSSRFPKKNRWGTFPSVGLAWNINKESFMQSQHLFDVLRVRASWGVVGNDQISTDAYTNTVIPNLAYPFSGISSGASNGSQINQIKDPNIKWESTAEYDFALEFGVLENKLSGELNYYNKKVDNALINVNIPSTVGDADHQILTNATSIQNTGVEVMIKWKSSVNKNLSYSIGANVTLNKNKVVGLNGGEPIWGGNIGAAQGFTTLTDNNHAIGSFYVLKVLGVFQDDPEILNYKSSNGTIIQPTAKPGEFKYWDKNDDGKIDDKDRDFAGSYQPKAYFGVNINVYYRKWDFSMDIYGNVGNKVYNGKRAIRINGKDNIESALVYNRWNGSQNPSQTQPGANTGNLLASDYFVESGDFYRINNLTVGYTFPDPFLKKLNISSLRVFITSQNLLTLKKYSGFTSELPGSPLDSGIELSTYPTTRTIALGVNLNF
ncbi:MAG: TonB-dependent receptor [Bacteroidales bacterium]|nr:TonB-dependent receptor [Bacteroidales bacterium]